MEALKSIVAASLSPLVISLALQLLGWLLLVRSRKRPGLACLAVGTLILFVGSFSGLTFEARRTAEYTYRPLATEDLPTGPLLVAVLGSGFNPDPQMPANSQVGPAFLARLLEGIRILRCRADIRLVVSVAGPADDTSKSQFLAAMLQLVDVDPQRVQLITTAESTLDEAALVNKLNLQKVPVVLATSASHMPRAVRIFADAGMTPIAAPTDFGFVRAGSPRDKVWPRWIPSTDGLAGNHAWLYEKVATLWQMIRPT